MHNTWFCSCRATSWPRECSQFAEGAWAGLRRSPESLSKPYSSLPNRTVQAANGIDYAYRDTGHPPRTVEVFPHENRELFR